MFEQRFYTVKDLQDLFQVSRKTIWVWEKEGLLSSFRIGQIKRFPADEVESLIEQKKQEAKAKS